MKLSDAMMLGRHLVKPAFGWSCESHEGEGCALTMAGLAAGRAKGKRFNVWQQAEFEWPWLQDRAQRGCPCCSLYDDTGHQTKRHLVTHLFDHHVARKQFTFEQLVDFVRSIEPPEAETDTPCEAKNTNLVPA